jgi:hypothetical protein
MPSGTLTRNLPSVEYLQECFVYNPGTGMLRWLDRPREHFSSDRALAIWNGKHAWTAAGCVSVTTKGYRIVGLDGVLYLAHRIVWKLFTGDEPPRSIDHIDGDPDNNRWNNLRPATMVEQSHNRVRPKSNSSGYRGVHQARSGRWVAQMSVRYYTRYLGTFDTPEMASAAYEAAAREVHGAYYLKFGDRKEK